MNPEAFGERSFRGPPSRTLVCCTSESLPIIAWVVDGQTDSYHWQFRNMYPSFMRWITLKQRNSRGLTPQICTIPLPKLCQLFSHINRRVDFQGKWQKVVLTSNFAFLVNWIKGAGNIFGVCNRCMASLTTHGFTTFKFQLKAGKTTKYYLAISVLHVSPKILEKHLVSSLLRGFLM